RCWRFDATTEAKVERLSRKVEEQATELERLRALVEAPTGSDARDRGAQVSEARGARGRRRLRAGRGHSDEGTESPGLVSRRRLFGLLGGAAAAGAGLAVAGSALGADPAGAATGDNFITGNSNSGSSTTSLTTDANIGFQSTCTFAPGIAVKGVDTAGTTG